MASPPPSFTCARLAAWTFAAVLLQILGLSLFVIGFFPVKPTLRGFSGPESYRMPTCDLTVDSEELELPPDQLRSLYKDVSNVPPSFDRLILMVIDGLPAEFVMGRGDKVPSSSMMESMPYTQSLLSDGRAIAYHAKAAPPTVTMPRLKAMVSGAIGGFLDVAFNFNAQAFSDDNLLGQFYRIGWKMVMLGDETWIKLFHGLFTRQDGVSSFYVKDTVEVDFNVSRHLEVELSANDWSLLILHYLGLDHVGHIGGRQSVLMAPKLKEMDDIIKMICMHKILHQDNLDERTLLVVVSDHGMTDGGNHGGSSFEETDSLALFIGLGSKVSDHTVDTKYAVSQVDIAPTLALLFGVPIPKNNVGVLLIEAFNSLTNKQILRALELNSWQLLRLLQAHLPGLLCGDLSCGGNGESDFTGSFSNTEERLCHLFSKARNSHNLWELRLQDFDFISDDTDDFRVVVASYYDFLGNASEWLSHRATDKPISLLLSGVAIMLISFFLLLSLFIWLFKEAYFIQKHYYSQLEEFTYNWQLEEVFIILAILIHVISLGASSMVEEEQYTWHFLASSLYVIFLFMTIQSHLKREKSGPIEVLEGERKDTSRQSWRLGAWSNDGFNNYDLSRLKILHNFDQIWPVLIALVCGRILRGWHQGGVNWNHLPDISRWLECASASRIMFLQTISLFCLLIINSASLGLVRSGRKFVLMVIFNISMCGLLILLHIMEKQSENAVAVGVQTTVIAQMLYITISITILVTALVSPWIISIYDQETPLRTSPNLSFLSTNMQVGIQDSTYLIGTTYTASWCLLQLLLQQPINAVPVLLVFLQLMVSIIYFSTNESRHRQWVEVAALHFLGMAGHFGLGNSNSIATIDVAGAFIGISSHSTILSGILMFIITYGSPVLSFLSTIMCISVRGMSYCSGPCKSELGCVLQLMIAFPCLLPLVLNSVVLTAFTIILVAMRNHLFVWSVFSPKYLYVCAATVSVYVGVCVIAATEIYVCSVFLFRAKMRISKAGTS